MNTPNKQLTHWESDASHEQYQGNRASLGHRQRWMKRRWRHMNHQNMGQPVNLTITINNGPQGQTGVEASPTGPVMGRRHRRGLEARLGVSGGRHGGRRHGDHRHGDHRQGDHGLGEGRHDRGRRGRTMKITTPQGYVIEMSTEEAQAMFPDLFRGMRQQVAGMSDMQGMSGEGDGSPISERRLVRRVLKRHRIPPAQRAVYRALYEAGDDGLDFVTLAATIGRSTEELSGVLGGLGRRINATPGIETLPETPGVGLLFEHKEIAPPNGTWGWAMRPEFRQVLTELDLPWLTGEDDSIESA